VPASRRPVLKAHCGGIGLRDGNRGQTRSMMWYFCGDRAGRRVKEMVVELCSFRVKGDASRGENMHDVLTLMGARSRTWSIKTPNARELLGKVCGQSQFHRAQGEAWYR